MKVGFTGPFADSNFGDYGMLVNNLYALGSVEHVTIYSYDDVAVSNIWAEYLPEVVADRITVEFFVGAVEALTENGRHPTPLEILSAVSNRDELELSIGNLDVLVVNGGGYWNELWCLPHRLPKLIAILVPALIADTKGKRIVFTSNGFGPFGKHSAFLADLLSTLKADYHVRDVTSSGAELRRIGIQENDIHYAPDDLFFYEQRLLERKPEIPDIAGRYVIFETYAPIDHLQRLRPDLSEFSQAMSNRGFEIVVMPFYGGRGGVDQSKWLHNELGWRFVDIESRGFLRLEDARSLIRGSELVLCERYHAAVVALANGVPVVHALRDVAGDQRYYYSKSSGATYTAWGEKPVHSPHIAMATSLYGAIKRTSIDFERIVSEQLHNHRSVPPSVRADFVALRRAVIDRVRGEPRA